MAKLSRYTLFALAAMMRPSHSSCRREYCLNEKMVLRIRPFEARDQETARRLILAGLGEHFGWIDETRNPDLDDIAANYVDRGSTFLVAEIDGKLVGTAALVTERKDTGRIVRMSVSQMYRRKGIGRVLVSHLLDVARQKGFVQIRVSTDNGWEDAIGLYGHCGFTEFKRDEIGVYFVVELADEGRL